MEANAKTIGATELRRRLTDVLQAVRERNETFVIETFDRSQAVLVPVEEYRQFQRFRREREQFFDWMEASAATNAEQNAELADDEVAAIIAEARREVAST